MEDSKKKEMATYSKLGLYRTTKSKRRREFVEDKGLYVFIGDNRSGRPWIQVLRAHYDLAWEEALKEAKMRPRPDELEEEIWLDLLRPQLEQAIYDRLLGQTSDLEQLTDSFEKQHGRKMTPYEKERYSLAMEKGVKKNPKTAQKQSEERAEKTRKHWIGNVMGKIRKTQNQRPARLQLAWASVVGTEAAMDSNLEGIDAIRGVAYCRCISSARRFELGRQSDLPKRLGEVLKQSIKRIVFK
jgi:hypothetical protein